MFSSAVGILLNSLHISFARRRYPSFKIMHGHKGVLWSRVEISSRSWKDLKPGGGVGPQGDFSHTHEPHTFGASCTNSGNRCANRCTG